MSDPVIFRMFRDELGEELTAWLPTMPANRGQMVFYVHVGQHGEGDYEACLSRSRLATPEEYADLSEELTSIGYEVKVYRRDQPKWRDERWV